MTFFAAAPHFHPLEAPPQYDQPVRQQDIHALVEVSFGETEIPQVWFQRDTSSYRVEDAGEEFGLKKRSVWYLHLKTGAPKDRTAIDYYARSSDGRIRALIECPPGQEGFCLHTFYRNGWTYTFNHRPADIPNWRSMQERISSLTASFVISERIVSIKP